jgi:hypothetical protein
MEQPPAGVISIVGSVGRLLCQLAMRIQAERILELARLRLFRLPFAKDLKPAGRLSAPKDRENAAQAVEFFRRLVCSK